jgi:diguanylate cyclase
MVKYQVAATPQNYAVWYAYVSGISDELRAIIDGLIAKDEPFTEQVMADLYRRFGLAGDSAQTDELKNELKKILLAILVKLNEFCGRTGAYETTLTQFIDRLSPDATFEDIRSRFDEVIADTKAMGEVSKAIEQTLEEKTEELNLLRKEFERARSESLTDFLTGASNRKAFEETIEKMIRDAGSKKCDLCLLMIDIDHFKKFNDLHGHLIGDEVLKFVAKKIKEILKGTDFVARYGGEEFAVILPKTTLEGAKTVAENIRSFFAEATLKSTSDSKPLGRLTVSIGVALYRADETAHSLTARSDQALYAAKKSGRNRAVAMVE